MIKMHQPVNPSVMAHLIRSVCLILVVLQAVPFSEPPELGGCLSGLFVTLKYDAQASAVPECPGEDDCGESDCEDCTLCRLIPLMLTITVLAPKTSVRSVRSHKFPRSVPLVLAAGITCRGPPHLDLQSWSYLSLFRA